MEDVLDLYAEPYDPHRPVVCFDETSTQLLADVRGPLPVQPGRPRRQSLPRTGYGDYEYRRAGTRNIVLACEPLAVWRHVDITERRTMQDFACQMQWLVDVAYLNAPMIRVVLDNPCAGGYASHRARTTRCAGRRKVRPPGSVISAKARIQQRLATSEVATFIKIWIPDRVRNNGSN